MKSPSKTELQSFLDKLKSATKRFDRRTAELGQARRDAEAFTAKIEELGTPHYNDDAAIQTLATSRLKLQACTDVEAKLAQEVEITARDVVPLINDGGELCRAILEPVWLLIVDEVTAVILPVCLDERSAREKAKNMDRSVVALHKVREFGAMHSRALVYQTVRPAEICEYARLMSAVISEALKPDGNLRQFLTQPPRPATPAAA